MSGWICMHWSSGQSTRKQRVEKKESESNSWEVPMALRQKTSFPEFQRFLQAREREQRAASRLKGASDTTSSYAEVIIKTSLIFSLSCSQDLRPSKMSFVFV